MRKNSIPLLLLPLLLAGQARADSGTVKLVKLKAGDYYGYMVSRNPKLTYGTGDNMFDIALTDPKALSVELSNVQRYTFTNGFELHDTYGATGSNLTNAKGTESLPSNVSYGAALLSRTLVKGKWNTFCVPFAMTAAQVKAIFGEGAKLRKYMGHNGSVIQFESCTAIEAGVAYLVNPSKDVTNPTITDVTVSVTAAKSGVDTDGYGFQGILQASEIKNDGTNLTVTAAGKLGVPKQNEDGKVYNEMRGMRAYIVIPSKETVNAKAFTLDLDGDGVVTVISDIESDVEAQPKKVFSLSGQYLGTSTEGLKKGVYVVDGRKVVIK